MRIKQEGKYQSVSHIVGLLLFHEVDVAILCTVCIISVLGPNVK